MAPRLDSLHRAGGRRWRGHRWRVPARGEGAPCRSDPVQFSFCVMPSYLRQYGQHSVEGLHGWHRMHRETC
jgi:hypothetical protein